MRIGCLQFAPQVGDVDNNLNRADSVLSKANPEDLDLLVLPELAFTGYNFKSLQEISPFLEPSGSGITSLWARTIALKYNCYVTVGYPEKVDVSPKWPTGPEYYNSAIVVNGDGETIANYRKSFLYYTDETWALEGNKGFYDGYLPGLGNTSIGICMDLNPYKFEAPWHAFEFAFHVLEVESNLVIVSMAWLTRDDPRPFSRMPNEPDMDSLTYWVTRLEPLIRSDNQEEIIVVFCNRTGTEGEATYSGTSAVIGIHDGEVKVYGLLGRGEKELLLVDTNNPPYAKMVYRPETDSDGKLTGSLERSPTSQFSSSRSNLSDNRSDVTSKPSHNEGTGGKASGDKEDNPTTNRAPSEGYTTYKSARSIPREPNGRSRSPAVKHQAQSAIDALPPLPTLPNNFKEPSKRRAAPTIDIRPRPKVNGHNDSSKFEDTDAYNIPTPSAPSPTPMAIRPKLIIPESPTTAPFQYTMDNPISAASEMSERSVQSVKSNESTQTVRSNPRPPEDSTPYPHSGMPLSGYPSSSFRSDKRIYGGQVKIGQPGDFTPITPFDDASPSSPRWFWRPPSNMIRTPVNGGAHQSGTPVGRKPEPFPWSEIRPGLLPLNEVGDDDETQSTSHRDAGRKKSTSPESNTSSRRARRIESTKDARKPTPYDKSPPTRRSPSKQRSVSSTIPNGVGAVEQDEGQEGEIPVEVSQLLSNLAQRSDSVVHAYEHTGGTPVPDRPSSPKSRNCSRSRPSDAADFLRDQTIHIVASPSILDTDRRASPIVQTPASQMQQLPLSRFAHQRSNSFTALASERTGSPLTGSNIKRPLSRAASRGRQPGPKGSPTKPDAAAPPQRRAPSVDSVAAAAYYSQFRNTSSQSQGAPGGPRVSRGHGSRRRSSQGPDLSQFERVEAVVCPNCPVHGSRSASADQSNNRIPMQQSSEPLGPPGLRLMDEETVVAAPRSATVPLPNPRHEMPLPKKTPSPVSSGNQTKGESSRGSSGTEELEMSDKTSLQTVSSTKQSPETPTFFNPFNPTTPKAMSFNPDDFGVDSFSDNSGDEAKKVLHIGTDNTQAVGVSEVVA